MAQRKRKSPAVVAAAVDSSPDQLWSDAERHAWNPPEDLRTSQWAEKNRVLTRRQSSRPGEWLNANQPTLVGIMDLADRNSIRELWIKKFAQGGISEAIRNVIGRKAHLDPAPVMLVLPNEKKGREIVRKRIIPLFEDTDVLKPLGTGSKRDKKLESLTLNNGFELSLAWAGSAAAMASDPFCIVILDEVDKYEGASKQADPVGEARVRIRTYGERGKVIALSTPSTEDGPIAVGFDACPIKLFYYVPCPHCGRFQQIVWDRIGFEHYADIANVNERAAKIKGNKAAWLECENSACTSPDRRRRKHDGPDAPAILEHHKRPMLLAGYWGTEDGRWKVWFDGREDGEQPEGEEVGMYLPAWYDTLSETSTWHHICAEFVKCDGNPARLKDWYNLTAGMEWKNPSVPAPKSSIFEIKCTPNPTLGFVPPPAKTIPKWACRLLMTVDTQADYFYWLIRAYGPQYRSQRIDHGQASSLEMIEEIADRAFYRYENDIFPPQRCYQVYPDAGGGVEREGQDANTTDKVYQWCNKDPFRRIPIKGSSRPVEGYLRWRRTDYQDPRQKRDPYSVVWYLIDSLYWRDLLASEITATQPVIDMATGEVTKDVCDHWMLNDCNDDVYNRQMSNVMRVRKRKGRGFVDTWMPKTPGARHDYHDLETYALAMAHGPAQCHVLPTFEERMRMMESERAAAKAPPSGLTDPHGRPFLANRR